jgi:hypothetical protein
MMLTRQLRGGQPTNDCPAECPRARCFIGPTAESNTPTTPSGLHNSVIEAIPDSQSATTRRDDRSHDPHLPTRSLPTR